MPQSIATRRIQENVVGLFRDGVRPSRSLARSLGIGKTTVYRWHQNWRKQEVEGAA